MKSGGDADERRVVEVKARTVDEAVARGLVRLGGLSRSEVKIDVLHEPKAGLLGFGSSEAEVRLTTLLPGERPEDVGGMRAAERPAEAVADAEAPPMAATDAVAEEEPSRREMSDERPAERPSGRGAGRGRAPARPAEPRPERPARPRTPRPEGEFEGGDASGEVVSPDEAEAAAIEVTSRMVELLGLDGVTVQRVPAFLPPDIADDRSLVISVSGPGSQSLLGFDSAPLQALQFLVRLVLSRKTNGWVNLLLDVDGDRARRVTELLQLARQSADLVEREGRPVSLPPMSGYERRIVHLVLKDHPLVGTQSIGTGERRKVTVRRIDQMLPELGA